MLSVVKNTVDVVLVGFVCGSGFVCYFCGQLRSE